MRQSHGQSEYIPMSVEDEKGIEQHVQERKEADDEFRFVEPPVKQEPIHKSDETRLSKYSSTETKNKYAEKERAKDSPLERRGPRPKRSLKPKQWSKIFIIILTCLNVKGNVNCSPIARILSDHISLNEDLTIRCVFMKSSFKGVVWLKGQDKRQLSNGNSSSKISKYVPKLFTKDDTIYCDLTIKDFQLTDIDYYICQFNIETSDKLFIDTDHIPYKPSVDDIHYTAYHKHETIDISLQIKNVFPEPNCTTLFEGMIIVGDVNTTLQHPDLKIYRSNVMFHLSGNNCSGNLNITCFISDVQFTVPIDFKCDENPLQKDEIEIQTVAACACIVFICVFLVIVGVIRRKKPWKKGYKKTEAQDNEMHGVIKSTSCSA